MKKLLTVALVMVMVLGVMGGVAVAEDECPAAPAVAGKILQENDIDFRYEDGEVDHPRHGIRILYSNYIATVAGQMTNGAEFPAYKCDGTWDEETYVEKCELDYYYWAVYNYLRSLGAELDCPFCGVLDPEASGAEFVDNQDGTGTLTVTLVDLCGNPILPDDFPIIPPTVIYDGEPDNFQNYFRANAEHKYPNDRFYYIGASWFPVAEGYGRADHEGEGGYTHTITKPFGYEDTWEIGIGPWVARDDVYVIEEEVEISIALHQPGLVLWLDAAYYNDEEGKWEDKSGEGNDATQDDNNKTPVYVADELKSNPVVRFDGENDYLDVPTSLGIFANATGGTIIAVASPTQRNVVETLIGWSVENNIFLYRYTLGKTVDDQWRTGGRRLDSETFETIAGGTIETGTFNIVSSVVSWENANLHLFVDGDEVASSDSFQTEGNTPDTDSRGMKIGARPDGNGNNWTGDIAEILIYDRELSADERKMVEVYLSAKYGL